MGGRSYYPSGWSAYPGLVSHEADNCSAPGYLYLHHRGERSQTEERTSLLRILIISQKLKGVFSYENSAVAKFALRKLNLSWNDLSSVSAWAVSQAAGRLEEVALCYSRLTVSQLQEVLVVVSSGGQEHIKLARLDLQGNNISALSPRILYLLL